MFLSPWNLLITSIQLQILPSSLKASFGYCAASETRLLYKVALSCPLLATSTPYSILNPSPGVNALPLTPIPHLVHIVCGCYCGLQGALLGNHSSAVLSLPIRYQKTFHWRWRLQESALTEVAILMHGYEKGEGGFKDTNPTLSNNHLKSALSVLWIELVDEQNTGMSVREKACEKSICTKIVFR